MSVATVPSILFSLRIRCCAIVSSLVHRFAYLLILLQSTLLFCKTNLYALPLFWKPRRPAAHFRYFPRLPAVTSASLQYLGGRNCRNFFQLAFRCFAFPEHFGNLTVRYIISAFHRSTRPVWRLAVHWSLSSVFIYDHYGVSQVLRKILTSCSLLPHY